MKLARDIAPLRYQFHASPVGHPWRRRYSAARQVTEPMIVEGRGIWDTQTRDWEVQPAISSHASVSIERLRELNGLPPLKAARVAAALRKAGHSISKWHASGQVRGWGDCSTGASVETCDDGRVAVSFACGRWTKYTPDDARQRVAQYGDTLTRAGLEWVANADESAIYL